MRARITALLLGGALGVTACTSTDLDTPVPKARPLAATTTTASTTPIDFGRVGLATVPGRTTTSIDDSPGHAHLAGTVTGPDGAPVAGAVVRAQRLVDDVELTRDIVTNLDGTWRLDLVKGGRYRVRAWRTPDLSLRSPDVLFLADDEDKVLPLRLERKQGILVTSSIAPTPPLVDLPTNLVVQVATRGVDDQGIVRAVPEAAAPVQLTADGRWSIDSGNPDLTDSGGRARFQITCQATGAQSLSVLVGSQSFPLAIPSCEEPPPPTTTTLVPETTTTAGG